MNSVLGDWKKIDAGETNPKGRSSHCCTWAGGRFFVHGGEDTPRHPFDQNLHCYDPACNEWSVQSSGSDVTTRLGHAMVSNGENTLYLYGGRNSDSIDLNDLWMYDLRTNQWQLIETSDNCPKSRSFHGFTMVGNSLATFGGCHASSRLNDIWLFDIRNHQWTLASSDQEENCPCIRGGPGLCGFENKIYLYAGYSGHELDDLYSFDINTYQWTSITPISECPSPRSVFASNTVGSRMFVFGGECTPSAQGHIGAGEYVNDSFYFDFQANKWAVASSSSDEKPSARGWHAAASDGVNRVFVFGGFGGTERLGDAYIWTEQ